MNVAYYQAMADLQTHLIELFETDSAPSLSTLIKLAKVQASVTELIESVDGLELEMES